MTGAAALDEVPRAKATIALAPPSAVLFVRIALPDVRSDKLARLLPLAIEDAIATSPEEVHTVLVEHVPGGSSLVAVVSRPWLASALAALAVHGFRPARFLIETELAAQVSTSEPAHPWVIVVSSSGGFAVLPDGETIALDISERADCVPLALNLARRTHRRGGEVPSEMLLFTSSGSRPPDVDAWSRALEVSVRNGGEWRPELIDARPLSSTDLLRGDFKPRFDARGLGPVFKLAGVTATAILGLHVLLTVGDWWRLSAESHQLKAQMESQFRQIFPDAQAVVDAPLQMRRSVVKLRREAGVPDASDFVPLLAAVGPLLVAAGAHTERVRYERGELELEIALPANERQEVFERRFVVPGYRFRFERRADAVTNVAILHVSVEA